MGPASGSRSIVLGVPPSGPTPEAFFWAVTRAARLKRPLILVHTLDDYWVSPDFSYFDDLMRHGREVLEESATKAGDLAPSVKVSTRLLLGDTARVLSDLSENSSLVVVGTHKLGRVESVIFGALSLNVAVAAVSPVAVIPEASMEGRSGVVVGVDGSAHSLASVAYAAREADRLGEDLYAVYSSESPNPRLRGSIPHDVVTRRIEEEERVILAESVAGLTEQYPDLVVHQHLELNASPAEALVTAASRAKLLVVGRRGRGKLTRLLLGSVSRSVLWHIECPTIVTPNRAVTEGPYR
ncbi:universal stress protein [Arthrobacter sp. TB 23]|uniref:universal stress protein n=1 Tax=Arthrobacter sp. TB 23 TaxID=494419 RepID=UPI0002DB85AC|nr:universal stress protein [Arthrobacter sp. TB 23]